VILKKISEFEEGSNFRAWAFSITRYEILSFLRDHKRLLSLKEEVYKEMEELAGNTEESPSISLKTLMVCFNQLKDKAKTMMLMQYKKGMSPKAIAGELKRPVDSIYTSLSRIRKSLFECFRKQEGFAEGNVK
jgi:RNA polymerase sigma-70 factor (ECF subfamily)